MKKLPCLPTKKQLRAYFLVEVMGEHQSEAAELMGISRTAISGLLKRFYKDTKAMNKGKAADTISLPGDYESRMTDIF